MTNLSREVSALFQSHQDVAVTDLSWLPAQSYALQLDGGRESWHAGHVSALLSDGTYVIAGTQTGGVWLLNPSLQPTYSSGHRATPLSNDWETPDISALAYGPEGKTQVYVGTANSNLLFFVELKPGLGEMTLDRVMRIPLPSTLTVFAIAIAQGQEPAAHSRPRIVLACSTVYSGPIYQIRLPTQRIHWQSAQGSPPGPISGLAPAGWSGQGRYELSSQTWWPPVWRSHWRRSLPGILEVGQSGVFRRNDSGRQRRLDASHIACILYGLSRTYLRSLGGRGRYATGRPSDQSTAG